MWRMDSPYGCVYRKASFAPAEKNAALSAIYENGPAAAHPNVKFFDTRKT
jgi:hypothetical protein